MNSKGANVIFTSIMIILLSVAAMIIIIGLVVPFFTSLKEEINFNHNKENLLLINNELVELKNFDINTFKNLNIDVVDEIVFDATTNTVYIKQKISNNSFKNFKDTNIGNLTIVKGNGLMTFTLDLDGIVTLDETTIINNNFTLKATIVDIVNDVPVISITQYLGQVYLTISPKLNTFISSLEITLTSTPTNANIYYTTDGTEPTESSTLYTAPFTITDSTTIKARGYANGYTTSAITSRNYVEIPLLDFNLFSLLPDGNAFTKELIVTAYVTPIDANIYYTLDGNDPTDNSTLYTGPITITDDNTTLKLRAFKYAYSPSEIITRIFTEITGLLFYNKYDTNTTTDLSDNNPEFINKNITFDSNGVYFDNNSQNYLLIKNDWNSAYPALNLGNNNFTLEAFVSNGYRGTIFSKKGMIGGMSLSINDDGNVEFFFSAADQFSSPYDITNDGNYFYITDTGLHRIQKRRMDNWELVLMHGGPLARSSIDSYNNPTGIAVDDNFVYISDTTNHRIIKRNKSDFSYHSMLSNSAGSGSNQLYNPRGIAVDDNYIYIVDSYYHRVKKLDKTTFELIATLGGTAAGSGDNQFSYPRGIAVDDDYMYVTEIGYDKIKKYNKSDFTFVSKAGTTEGIGNDQLYNPEGVSIDDNYIYIADVTNKRIMIRNKDLNMTYYNKISSVGTYGDINYIYWPYGVTVDDNYIYYTDNATHRIKKSKKSDLSLDSIYSDTSITAESSTGPYGIVSDDEHLYYVDYYLHRLVKRRISDMKAVASSGGPFVKNVSLGFYNPVDLAIDDDYVYVGDNTNNAVKKYNKSDLSLVYTYAPGNTILRSPFGLVVDGNYLYMATNYTNMHTLYKINISTTPWVIDANIGGAAGSGNNQFNAPYGVTVDDTYVYVADYSNHRIKKHLKSDLSYVSQLGITTYSNYFPNTQNNPIDVVYDNNYLYVLNTGAATVRKYTMDFNYVSSIAFLAGYSNDELLAPRSITISNGYMYITDITLGRITKRDLKDFDANITFAGAGTDFNFFYSPVSVDSDENYYYVVDSVIHRLEKIDKSTNEIVAYLGGPYYVTTSTSTPARSNYFYLPNDVLLDGDYIYVSDRTNHRVVKLNKSDLSYISQFGTGSYGSTTTQLYGPRQLAIYDNNLYVADFSNNRIMILDKNTMTYLTHFGTTGTGNDQFSGIYGVGVDENYIFTLEYYNNRIKKINKSDFTYITHIGGTSSGSGDDQFSSPLYLSLDENYIYVSDNLNYRIKKHLKSDLSFVSKIGSSGLGDDQFRTPFGIKYKDENTLLVADATNNRIHIRNPSDLSFVSMIDLSTYTNDGLYSPYGVAVDDDYLYISDFSNNRIVKKDKTDLSLVASVGNPISGSGDDQFYLPYGVAVDDDYIYINDSSNCRIVKRNKSDLSYVSKLSGGCGTGNTQIRYNYGIAVDDNYIYVTEGSYHRVKKFTKDTFTFVASIGGTASGKGDDQFTNPRGIAVYGDYIYVVDMGNHRIHKRNKDDLSLVELYGLGISGANSTITTAFYEPVGVEVHDDILYIVDFRNNRIKVYDTNFNFLYKFGNAGWGQDQFYLPTDIAIDDEFVYIADQSNHRVIKRSLSDLENMKNIPLTNSASTWGYNSNLLTSNNIITTDSQIVLKRSGSDICIYINGVEDICENYSNTPTYFTYPEVNVHYGASATTTTYYLSENQNYYPWGVGNYGLSPGNGHLKYLRLFDTNLSDSDINALYQSYK